MAGATVSLTLPQMIDCAVSYPECGSVNFVMLHSVLQVLVQQMELVSCNVEFKGKEGDLVQNLVSVSKDAPKVTLTEYVVTPPKDAGKHLARGKKGPSTDANTVHIDDIAQDDLKTVVVIEADGGKPDSQAMVISQSNIDDIKKDIQGLKKNFKELSEMPANQTLINAIRQAESGKGTPILEIFQSVSLTKRMDSTDAQVKKLAAMIEDLIKSNPNLGCPPGTDGAETLCDRLKTLDQRVNNVEQAIINSGGTIPTVPDPSSGTGAAPKPGAPAQPPDQAAKPGGKDGQTGGQAGGQPGGQDGGQAGGQGAGPDGGQAGGPATPAPPPMPAPSTDVPDFSSMDLEEFKKIMYDQLKEIKDDIKKLYDALGDARRRPKRPSGAKKDGGDEEDVGSVAVRSIETGADDRLTDLENAVQDMNQQMTSMDTTFNNEFHNMQEQFTEMEKEFGSLMEKIHVGAAGGEGQVSGESVSELYEKILGIQTDMENLADTASKLLEDKEQKEKLIDVLNEQVDMLKTVKADKEDLEDALADKADACAINRKVSHDQFDTACDELSKGIEEALSKLTQQEQLWQSALDEIQREIGNKLDRVELGPLREFINQKLKVLQQRLKALMALKQETEAAGTKKFLKNVQCISCDKDVIMRKELDPSVLPQPYALPPTRSMGPYLAYELDALRKQQKALPTSRNLNHFESALHSKSPRPGDDHICNRYCGGSHTITTPQQRVTRLGHFLNQWGPEAQPVCDTTKDDESPLVVSGRGPDKKSPPADQTSAKPSKTGAGDAAAAAVKKKESKEAQRKPSADKKVAAAKPSKSATQPKPSASKVSPKASPTKSPSKKISQASTKPAPAVEKQPSKTSAPKTPDEAGEEAASEATPSMIEGGEAAEGGVATESAPPPPSEEGAEADAQEASEGQPEETTAPPEATENPPEE